VPGPLLRTTDELAAALQDLDAVRADYANRYATFRATFCELDDGHAAARVVDRLF
jgi:CDP-glycerol glycerophosphotransferase